MARARNIKPGFFTNDELVEHPFEVRLLFIGLWTIADREGRLIDRPKKIRMEIFPADNVDCDSALEKLANSGFIKRYSVNGERYIQIVNWNKHQNPHVKEQASTLPAPDMHQTCTGLAPDMPGSCPADSGFPLTDSIENPLSTVQAKIDPVHRLNGKKAMIEEIAGYLNLQAQRNFRVSNPNGTPTAGALVIEQRLKEGYTVAQCKDVIGVKSNEWLGDEKMHRFLNPETLFRKKNFTKYLAEAEAEIKAHENMH